MKGKLIIIAAAGAIGFSAAKIDDHVRPVMWGWVWELRPEPDFYGTQLVHCPNGDLTFPPWHVRVFYSNGGGPFSRWFLQERGR
jgi:hypothetical protein